MERIPPMRSLLVALLCLLAPGLIAQDSESLLIGPGDLLHVHVFDAPEFEERARVNDKGSVSLVFLGDVSVNGLVPSEASRRVQDALVSHGLLLHPQVTITVDEYATAKVSVAGEVRSPGAFAIMTPRSIFDVLSLAGGLTETAAREIRIKHRESGQEQAYFVSNDPGNALDHSLLIRPGDEIFVPRAGIVYAIGDFGRPGAYVMSNNRAEISVLELVARAGGVPPSAVPSHARLIRRDKSGGYVESPLPLSAMEKGKDADMQLKPDDIVYVPFSYLRNFAMNAASIAASIGSAAVYRY